MVNTVDNSNVLDFLENLRIQGIELWVEGDKLRYRGSKEVLTPQVFSQIKQYKSEILNILGQSQDSTQPYPLSSGQQALWFLYQLAPESTAYNIMYAVRLKPDIDTSVLEQAYNKVIARHPSLRTTYTNEAGVPVQQVCQDWQTQFNLTQTSDLSQEYLDNWLAENADRPFNLEQGDIIRAHLLHRSPDPDSPEQGEYILLLAAHHIATDFWSFDIIIDELCLIYQSLKEGNTTFLPTSSTQYQDYVRQEQQKLASPEIERQWDYWQQKLAGELPVLNLPLDKPRPPVQTYNGVSHYFTLEDDLSQDIRNLARKTNNTPYAIVLAAFQVLLFRYTSQSELVLGCPMAGRINPELEDIVGYFVNPVVLRQNLAGNPTFADLIPQTRQTLLEALDYQELPFPLLVEKLQPQRDSSRSPLFQASLVWDRPRQSKNNSATDVRQELILDYLIMEQRGAEFDLSLTFFDGEGILKGSWRYNSDLFDTATIERLAENFQTLLGEVVANPNLSIAELSILSAEEKQLLVEWNDTQVDFARDKCLHQMFEEQVAKTPDAIAVVFDDEQLTYQELNDRANQLARYIQSLIGERKSLIGICVERSIEMVVGLLGILKAGHAYIPLDPKYPKERLALMLEDVRVPVLLTKEKLLGIIPEHQGQTIFLDSDWKIIAKENQANPEIKVTLDDLAYIIFTSGSTGKPKGVMIAHKAICNHMLWMQAEFPLIAIDKVLQKTPFSFDASVWEFYAPLLIGAQLVIARPQGHQDINYLIRVIKERQITVLQVVPTLLLMLLEHKEISNCNSLKRVFCGGEALSQQLQERFFASLKADLHNFYGPTETCIDATFWTCKDNSDRKAVPIGRPISNLQTYVLDAQLRPLPIGVIGELHIGGAGLAKGYINNEKLTAERFYWHETINSRLYKTGDLVRYESDGNLEYLGRIDNQVKIRGFRIELGEIESVLCFHPQIEQAVVVATEDITGNKRLTAYLAVSPGKVTTNDMRQFLKHRLPEYMVPSIFVILEHLPLTANGKVDRLSLPTPEQFKTEQSESFIAPQDELELQLTKIWEKVLGINPIGINDNFFELGGHSLLAILLFAEIEKKTGKNLPLSTLFQAPSIKELANILRDEGWSTSWTSLVAIKPGGSKRPFFCIHGAGGHVLNYSSLARHLSPEQPFYALQAQGLDGKHPIHDNIQDMAAHYIKEIRELQPEGPYLLGGYCGGGKIALEMAQQLKRQGQEVSLLAFFNTFNLPQNPDENAFFPKLYAKVDFLIKDIGYHWGNLSLLKPQDKLTFLQERLRWAQRRFQTRVKAKGQMVPLASLLKLHDRLIREYVPEVYPGHITIFHTLKLNDADYDSRPGWKGLAAEGIEFHEIPAYFRGILVEPFVQSLAEQLEACLDRAEDNR